METATDTEAQLYQLLQCVEEGTKESQEPQDSFQQVDTIRTAASQLYAEAVKTNDEKFSCCLLRQYLDVYQESVVNPDAVNNYCDEVLNLLTAQQDDGERDHSGITESILDDPLTYVTDKRTCQGSYEDCFIWELNGFAVHAPVQCPDGRKEQVVENVLRSDPLRNVDHFGFKPTVCEGISEINSLDADEITRRVFAPRAASFTPKIPSTAKATIPNILAENPRSAGSSNKHDSNKGSSSAGSFRTAKDELQIQNIKMV